MRPVHEVLAKPDAIHRNAFAITRHEIRGEYLITTVFNCYISGQAWVNSRTIRVRDRNMRPVGKPDPFDRMLLYSFPVETDRTRAVEDAGIAHRPCGRNR